MAAAHGTRTEGPLDAPLTFRIDWGSHTPVTLLRYPGGKQRIYWAFGHLLPTPETLAGRFVEPFVGSGGVFFLYNPPYALLADINPELIDLYMAVREQPQAVWKTYQSLPFDREGYYRVRNRRLQESDLVARAARTLYLSRTCFKGQWRTNARGEFNIGYGGPDRRHVVTLGGVVEASMRLARAELRVADFEETIDACGTDDLLFCDPPYRPGARELLHQHYLGSQFAFTDHERLAQALRRATDRGVRWLLTTTAHPDIRALFADCQMYALQRERNTDTEPGEVIITNEGRNGPW